MDALVLDLAVQVMTTLSLALLAWGGWLSIGGAPRWPAAGATRSAGAG
jgi:hypothetical protein